MNNLLFLLILIVLVYITHLVILFFHELAHKRKLEKYGIKSILYLNPLKLIKSLAYSRAYCFFDKGKFDKLSSVKKKEIISAGIVNDLVFIGIFLILSILSWFYFKGSFLWYYLNLTSLILVIIFLIGFLAKGSDFGKLKILKDSK